MLTRKSLSAAITVLVSTILLCGCGKKDEPSPPSATPDVKPETPALPKSAEAPELRDFTIADLKMEFRAIKPGTFTMGAAYLQQTEREVALTKASWMAATEVTQAQYEAVMGSNPSDNVGPSLPVEAITWDEAVAFCEKLTAREKAAGRLRKGHVYRLPTEAEWEYCCGAGATGEFAGDVAAMAWTSANSGRVPHPVGTKAPNAWKLFDMHGNVYEWCLDWYADYPAGAVTDPTGPKTGTDKVFRGGCYIGGETKCRSAARAHKPKDDQGRRGRGMRVVLAAAR